MSHTPGPWKVAAAEFKGDGLVAYEIRMPRPEIGFANAHLIAAAPEMLHALELAERALDTYTERLAAPTAVVILEVVRAAIRKAEEGA